MNNDELAVWVEERRGRPLSLAERNIDLAGLTRDLNEGKEKLAAAIEREQARAARRWARNQFIGTPRVRINAEMRKILSDLYDLGERHGERELRAAGYAAYASKRDDKRRRMQPVLDLFARILGGLNGRLTNGALGLDLGSMSAKAIADALAKIPGALDAAGRIVSTGTYMGLGAAFDRAADLVDVDGVPGAQGGNGWERTEVMDGGTCPPCAEGDGRQYDTWAAAQYDMPNGGPAIDCRGQGRCRGRLAPVPL